MTKDFDPADTDNETTEVPADLLPEVLVFHRQRSALSKRVKEANAEYQAAVDRYNRKATEITTEMDSAIAGMRRTLVEKDVIAEDEPFFLDTSKLERHGHAYIVTEPDPDATPRHTVH